MPVPVQASEPVSNNFALRSIGIVFSSADAEIPTEKDVDSESDHKLAGLSEQLSTQNVDGVPSDKCVIDGSATLSVLDVQSDSTGTLGVVLVNDCSMSELFLGTPLVETPQIHDTMMDCVQSSGAASMSPSTSRPTSWASDVIIREALRQSVRNPSVLVGWEVSSVCHVM